MDERRDYATSGMCMMGGRKGVFLHWDAVSLNIAKVSLLVQEQDNAANNLGNALSSRVDSELGVLGDLIRIINTSEALDLALLGALVDTITVPCNGLLERSGNVDEEESTRLLNLLASLLASLLIGSNGGNNDTGAGSGQLSRDKAEAVDVDITLTFAEAELRRKLATDGLTEQQGDGATTLLVEGDLEGTGNALLLGSVVTSQEDGETLLGAGRMGLAQQSNNLGVREPLGDVGASAETTAELSSGNVEGLGASGDLIRGDVLVRVGQVGDLLERHDLNVDLVLVLLDKVLGIVRAVEILAGRILSGASVVTANDEVGGSVVLTDNGVPECLTGTSHAHGQGQERESSHAGGVAANDGLVDTDTSEVVNVTGLSQTNDGVDEDVGLARAGSANSQLAVSTVHGIAGLESNDTGPVELLEVGAELSGSV